MHKKKDTTDLHKKVQFIIQESVENSHREGVEHERGYEPPIYFNEPLLFVHVAVEPRTLHRIWANSVYLSSTDTEHTYKLRGMLNVAQYPALTPYHGPSVYTLLFERPAPEVKTFTVFEDIPEMNGLVIENIERNDVDVYFAGYTPLNS